ncbi:MAG: hypothetical protein JWL70_1638, partial [Acidimicrobiia bacterium]|nr:hypothetical protein [Acidimicrobiia bacterium]
GVPMSCLDTGVQQRLRLEQLGMRTELLAELRDIDNIDDAWAVASSLPGSRTAAALECLAAGGGR